MFGFFKRTKLQHWEIDLLKTVLNKLDGDYSILLNQINEGLIKSVLIDASDIPGYVLFRKNHDIFNKYYKDIRCYILSDIKVFNKKNSTYLKYDIYILSAVVNGYSLNSVSSGKLDLDLNKIDISSFKVKYLDEFDYERVVKILDKNEIKLINPSNVYSIFLDNKEYFHLKDLEDGDFIAIDSKKNIYKIKHDPFEITKISQTIIQLFS